MHTEYDILDMEIHHMQSHQEKREKRVMKDDQKRAKER